jgi:hypothetical protein
MTAFPVKLRNGLKSSIGRGNIIVELLSVETSAMVCRYLNCSAMGCFSIITEASDSLAAA